MIGMYFLERFYNLQTSLGQDSSSKTLRMQLQCNCSVLISNIASGADDFSNVYLYDVRSIRANTDKQEKNILGNISHRGS